MPIDHTYMTVFINGEPHQRKIASVSLLPETPYGGGRGPERIGVQTPELNDDEQVVRMVDGEVHIIKTKPRAQWPFETFAVIGDHPDLDYLDHAQAPKP